MKLANLLRASALSFCSGSLFAWTPHLHEVQTAKALRLVPRRMAAFLRAYPQALVEAARGQSNEQPPTVEEIDSQFRTILRMSEEKARPQDLVRELARLAHLVQALHDPSCLEGVTPLREAFEAYAEERQSKLVVTNEPFWALTSEPDPKAKIQSWMDAKLIRNKKLRDHFDEDKAKRIGAWDDLSVPFAQLQLAFSGGIQATANLWILLYRATGDAWPLPEVTGS
jgi:hypothetical protein